MKLFLLTDCLYFYLHPPGIHYKEISCRASLSRLSCFSSSSHSKGGTQDSAELGIHPTSSPIPKTLWVAVFQRGKLGTVLML